MENMDPTIKLKTNFLFNLVKLFVAFVFFLILGVVAKVFPYYHLETLILALVIGTTLWFYRLRYKGKLEHDGYRISAVMRINVSNHKVVRIKVERGSQKIILKYSGKLDSMDFEDPRLSFKLNMSTDFRKTRSCILRLFKK